MQSVCKIAVCSSTKKKQMLYNTRAKIIHYLDYSIVSYDTAISLVASFFPRFGNFLSDFTLSLLQY
jgi:hypothetical protein